MTDLLNLLIAFLIAGAALLALALAYTLAQLYGLSSRPDSERKDMVERRRQRQEDWGFE